MVENNPFASFEQTEGPDMRFGVPVTPADEDKLTAALMLVRQSEIAAWATADTIIG